MKRIGILTAGGDTPALNATIHGAVVRANQLRIELVGLIKGFNSQFARFLAKLKTTEDGDGSLLDHTQVLFGSGMGNANAHTNSNLPLILAGGGFRHGGHLSRIRKTAPAGFHSPISTSRCCSASAWRRAGSA